MALFARREDRLLALRDSILAAHPGAEVIAQKGDVRDRARVREAVAEAESRFGGLDVILANAGIGESLLPETFDAAIVEEIMAVNFLGAVYGIEAALPGMLSRRSGAIACVSSISAVRGLPASGPYCASKAALTTFLESLRLDLRGTGVKVVTISPGFIRTPLTDRNRFPMPFLQTPERAARIIVDGILAGKREIHFPKQLTVPLKLLGCLPRALSDIIVAMTLGKRYRKDPGVVPFRD